MKKLLITMLMAAFVVPLIEQDVGQLDEVVVKAVNYKYLSAVDNSNAPIPIWSIEKEAAIFDVTNSDVYLDEYNMYHVIFRIPDGVMVVAYDANGNIIKTIERFKNYQLPDKVSFSIKEKYPEWTIIRDLFLVTYSDAKGADKMYKIKLKKGEDIMRVKLDIEGNYL